MTFAEFVQPGNYNRSDVKVVCGHNIPVGPGACVECHALTDDHQRSGCTCDLDAYDAERAQVAAEFGVRPEQITLRGCSGERGEEWGDD
jgi:hypothetical protein